MNALKVIEEGFVVMKTTVIAMLLGLMVAVTGPAFGVTDPLPSLVEAEAAAVAEGQDKSGMWGSVKSWVGTRKNAVVHTMSSGYENLVDPEKKNVALKALVKELRLDNQVLREAAAKKSSGNAGDIDTLKGCAVDLTAFLNTLEPE
ncbi:MAG: hypothetical protein V3S69_05770 [Dehalococcoidales bacterium]